MLKTVLIFIIITPIVIISSTAKKFDCPTANFDASVAINECFALLFNAKFMWLLDVCNFRLSTVYNFEPELLKCFHNDGHNGPNRQQQQQQSKQYENEQRQQLIAWNRFRKMKSTIMMYNNYPNSNFICMELNNQICYFPIIITEQYPSSEFLNTIGNMNSMEDEMFRSSCQSDVIDDDLMTALFMMAKK
ncbi:hypothetical protein DERF_008345 [Dermatophagoides farinae]|uniref:Uncharacterized protein n=1 Tax=Dermatophagoides farinae TaxID=6954 RepID=A0A922HZR8_DERFA|nr:hypothetical protein DERF_008345 [Dermatophagoides farinae]